jgi:hypothetical protein
MGRQNAKVSSAERVMAALVPVFKDKNALDITPPILSFYNLIVGTVASIFLLFIIWSDHTSLKASFHTKTGITIFFLLSMAKRSKRR